MTAVTYRVGDPDPTPDVLNDGEVACYAIHPEDGCRCTWVKGHDGPHVAGGIYTVVAVWP